MNTMYRNVITRIASIFAIALYATSALSNTQFVIDKYKGNATSSEIDSDNKTNNINTGIDLSASGGLVIIKSPLADSGLFWFDSERSAGAYLDSTKVSGESVTNYFVGFTDTGFTMKGAEAHWNLGGSEYQYLAMAEKAGFLDIITYTGDGEVTRALDHKLNDNVGMVIIKAVDSPNAGAVWHSALSNTESFLSLNLFGYGHYNPLPAGNWWGHTQPTSSQIFVGNSLATNTLGTKYVAYVFADNPANGVTVGSYMGSDTDGALTSLPWQPDALILKPLNTSHANNWTLWSPRFGDRQYGMLNQTWAGFPTSAGASMLLSESKEFVKTTMAQGHEKSFNELGKQYLYIAFKGINSSKDPALVAEYLFESPTSLGKDTSGAGLDGAVIGQVSVAETERGFALSLNGDGRIEIPDNDLFSISENGLTVSFWAKHGAYSGREGIVTKSGTGNAEWTIERGTFNSDIFGAGYHRPVGSTIHFDGVPYPKGNWNFYTVVFTGADVNDEIRFYRDGELINITNNFKNPTYNGQYANSAGPLTIGHFGGGAVSGFVGEIDDVRIYSQAKATEEIGTLYLLELKGVANSNSDLSSALPVADYAEFSDLGEYSINLLSNDYVPELSSPQVILSGADVSRLSAKVSNDSLNIKASAPGVYKLSYQLKNIDDSITESVPITIVVNSELVAEYLFEDSSALGTDSSGYGFHGSIIGSAIPVQGQRGRALSLNGDGRIEIPDNDLFSISENGLTVSFWAKHGAYSGREGIVTKSGTGNAEWTIERGTFNSDIFGAGYHRPVGSTIHFDGVPYPKGNWNFYTVVFTGADVNDEIRFYRDGELINITNNFKNPTYNGQYANSAGPLTIGHFGDGAVSGFVGEIDDVRIHSKAKSSQEVTALYESISNVVPSVLDKDALVAEYLFDDIANISKDTSGHANHGVVFGDVLQDAGVVGNSVKFGGAGFIEIADKGLLTIDPTLGMSISFWISSDQINLWEPFIQKATTNSYEWAVTEYDKRVGAYIHTKAGAGVDGIHSSSPNPKASWTHHTVIFPPIRHDGIGYTPGNIKIYKNGQDVSQSYTQNLSKYYKASFAPLVIGKYFNNSGNFYFNGKLDNLRVFKGQLNAEQVKFIHEQDYAGEPIFADISLPVTDYSIPLPQPDVFEFDTLGTYLIDVLSNDYVPVSAEILLSGEDTLDLSAVVLGQSVQINVSRPGNYVISYQLRSPDGSLSDVTTISIFVAPQNNNDVANPDNFVVVAGNEAALNVTENDRLKGFTYSIDVPSVTALGIPLKNNNGVITYQSQTTHIDSFVYSVVDANNVVIDSAISYISVVPTAQEVPIITGLVSTPVIEGDKVFELAFDYKNIVACTIDAEKNPHLNETFKLFEVGEQVSSGHYNGELAIPDSGVVTLSCQSPNGVVVDKIVRLEMPQQNDGMLRIGAINVIPLNAMLGERQTANVFVANASKCWVPAENGDSEQDLVVFEPGAPDSSELIIDLGRQSEAGHHQLTLICSSDNQQVQQATAQFTRSAFTVSKSQVLVGEENTLRWNLPTVSYCKGDGLSNVGQLPLVSFEAVQNKVIKWTCQQHDGSETQFSTHYDINRLAKPAYMAIEKVQQ